jgi:hypothetical protein
MHVDAFFEYCLGHSHNYYTRLPSSTGPASESRDGVPLEEDLALRALVPEWKPKRGRKRAEDKEIEEAQSAKRPHLDTSVILSNTLAAHAANFPASAIPFSAFPDDMDPTDPWVAATSSFASDGHVDSLGPELRWRPLDRDTSPAGYPRSAIVPGLHRHGDMFVSAEPRSAVTPSSRDRSRTRRRHGPAVSSAWPSNSGSVTGKVRGRPPNRGSAPGGPFSSFPANPARSNMPGDGSVENPLGPPTRLTPTRPGKLQLHVPQNPGGPIRLATPPTLLVNGTNDIAAAFPASAANGKHDSAALNVTDIDVDGASFSSIMERGQPGGQGLMTSLDEVTRLLAWRILRANVIGRQGTIQTEEARALARAAVKRLRTIYSGVVSPGWISILCQMHLHVGIGQKLASASGAFQSLTVKINTAGGAENNNNNNSNNNSLEPPSSAGRQTQTQAYTYSLILDSRPAAGVSINSVLSDLSLSHSAEDGDGNGIGPKPGEKDIDLHLDEALDLLPPTDDDELNDSVAGDNTNAETDASLWRQRYLRLRQTMRKKEAALREYKRNILQSVMADM